MYCFFVNTLLGFSRLPLIISYRTYRLSQLLFVTIHYTYDLPSTAKLSCFENHKLSSYSQEIV